MDIVLSLCRSPSSDQLFTEILRVLKPGGTILLQHSESATKDTNKVINMCCSWLHEFWCWWTKLTCLFLFLFFLFLLLYFLDILSCRAQVTIVWFSWSTITSTKINFDIWCAVISGEFSLLLVFNGIFLHFLSFQYVLSMTYDYRLSGLSHDLLLWGL